MDLFKRQTLDQKDKIVFLVGCFATFYVGLIGRIYIGELIIFVLYIFKSETRSCLPKELKILTNLLYLWLASAIVSDLWNHTPYIDMIKGAISILFLIALIPFVYWALKDRLSRWIIFYFGTIISSQLTYYLITSQTEFGSTEIWRTYSYSPLYTGLAVFLYWKGKKNLSYITFLCFGVWILFSGSRNVFIVCSLTVIILYLAGKYSWASIGEQLQMYQGRIGALIVATLVGVVAIDVVYERLASSGTLGDAAYEKYMKQKNSSLGLASGRIEAIMDMDLISKSPIIGYGSYAKDKERYVIGFYSKHNIPITRFMYEKKEDSVENMLPRHSHIGGLWMWHGIGAGIFWIYILFIIFRAMKTGAFILEPHLMGLCVYTMLAELWNIFFSPMAERLPFLFMVVFLILINQKYQELKNSDYEEYEEYATE